MQYKVPQNIDMEDKIIGPFTMKQFIYLLVAGGIIYAWWSYLQKNYVDFMPVFLLVAIPVGLLGLAFALVKINDRPFEVFVLSLFQFLSTPKQRMWREGYKSEPVIIKDQVAPVENSNKPKDTRSLDDLSKSLDKQAQLMSQSAPVKKFAKSSSEVAVNVSVKDVNKPQTQSPAPAAKDNPKENQGAAQDVKATAAPKKKSWFNF